MPVLVEACLEQAAPIFGPTSPFLALPDLRYAAWVEVGGVRCSWAAPAQSEPRPVAWEVTRSTRTSTALRVAHAYSVIAGALDKPFAQISGF